MKPAPISRIIENGHGSRIVIAEHKDSCFICCDNGRGGTSLFLGEDELVELMADLMAIRRRLRKG